MALYAKQQISYLNMHYSLDTQEDKQAKALKEIYKLCKTDEGNDEIDGYLYSGLQGAARKQLFVGSEAEEGDNVSENSDKIKELFNKMITNQDEVNNEQLLLNI
jgi:hypothetical protein